MITIKHAMNGYIIETVDELRVVEIIEDNEAEAARDMLHIVNDLIGHMGSRHDKERVTIKLEPGDKYEENEEEAECE